MAAEVRPPINRWAVQSWLLKEALPRLHALADRFGIHHDDILPMAIVCYERSRFWFGIGYPKPLNELEVSLIEIVEEAARNILGATPPIPYSEHDRLEVVRRLAAIEVQLAKISNWLGDNDLPGTKFS